jgi:hypothetical protein
MKKSYRLILEVALDEADEQNAVRVARRHFRRKGPASTPVNWNRIGGKWRRVFAKEWIPDAEIAIMELIDANDLLEEAGIEVTSVSCGKVKPAKTPFRNRADSKGKHPVRMERPSLKLHPSAKAADSPRRCPVVHQVVEDLP